MVGFRAESPDWLWRKCFLREDRAAAAKAGIENKPAIAAVNRCATQNHVRRRVFRQPAKERKSLRELPSFWEWRLLLRFGFCRENAVNFDHKRKQLFRIGLFRRLLA
jgi:hypothetical protein